MNKANESKGERRPTMLADCTVIDLRISSEQLMYVVSQGVKMSRSVVELVHDRLSVVPAAQGAAYIAQQRLLSAQAVLDELSRRESKGGGKKPPARQQDQRLYGDGSMVDLTLPDEELGLVLGGFLRSACCLLWVLSESLSDTEEQEVLYSAVARLEGAEQAWKELGLRAARRQSEGPARAVANG